MEKYTFVTNILGVELWIGEKKLKAKYLSKVTDIILDVAGEKSYLTLSYGDKIQGTNKVSCRWLNTIELIDFSVKDLVSLIVDIVKLSSCEKLVIDSFAMGRAVIDMLIPILKELDKSHLIEFAIEEELKELELLEIIKDVEIKMDKLRKLVNE